MVTQVGHEVLVLFKRGEDHVDEAGGRQGVMRQERPLIRRVERAGARNVDVLGLCLFYFLAVNVNTVKQPLQFLPRHRFDPLIHETRHQEDRCEH